MRRANLQKEKTWKKRRFSLFELELKPNVDVDNLLIKKAGGSQPIGVNNVTTSVGDGKPLALARRSRSSLKNIKSKRKKKGKKMDNHNSFIPICGNTDIHSIGYLNGKP